MEGINFPGRGIFFQLKIEGGHTQEDEESRRELQVTINSVHQNGTRRQRPCWSSGFAGKAPDPIAAPGPLLRLAQNPRQEYRGQRSIPEVRMRYEIRVDRPPRLPFDTRLSALLRTRRSVQALDTIGLRPITPFDTPAATQDRRGERCCQPAHTIRTYKMDHWFRNSNRR